MEMESPRRPDAHLSAGTPVSQERTVGQLVAQASQDLGDIFRAEVALAKLEMQADVKKGAMGGALFGAAGYLALLASILLTIALAYGISAVGLAPGWAFLIVAVLFLLTAGIVAFIGYRRVSKIRGPARGMRAMNETVRAISPVSGVEPLPDPALNYPRVEQPDAGATSNAKPR